MRVPFFIALDMPFAIFRQSLFSCFFIAVSLPFLWFVHRILDLGSPPTSGVLLLGASVAFACVSGGALGFMLGEFKRGETYITLWAFGLGLVWGGVLCAIIAPLYTQSVLEHLAREGAAVAWNERDAFLDRQTGVASAVESAQSLAQTGLVHLPALSLLIWVFLGPAIGSAVEARRAARR